MERLHDRVEERCVGVSGLQDGDQVVTSGGLGLDDKAKVTIQQPKPEDDDEPPPDDETKPDDSKAADKGKK